MYIKSLSGNILFEGSFKTLRRCVEAAISDKVDLADANLRGANLRYGKLDEASLNGACLWGADLTHADCAGSTMKKTDFRATNLKDACLAESDLSDADFRGSYFENTIIRAAIFDRAQFSCPSVFSCDFSEAKHFNDAIYWHLGETACALPAKPGIIRPPVTLPLYNHKYESENGAFAKCKTL